MPPLVMETDASIDPKPVLEPVIVNWRERVERARIMFADYDARFVAAVRQEAASQVAEGMAYLDRVSPGWEPKIDLRVLDIADGTTCVCGQLALHKVFGRSDFYSLREDDRIVSSPTMRLVSAEYERLMARGSDARAHGFLPHGTGRLLTEVWTQAITARREARAA